MSIRLGSFIEAAAAQISSESGRVSAAPKAATVTVKRAAAAAPVQRQASRLFVPMSTRPALCASNAAA